MTRLAAGTFALISTLWLCVLTHVYAEPNEPDPHREFVDHLVACASSGDLATFLSPFADQVEVNSPMGHLTTPEQVKAWAKWHTDGHFHTQHFGDINYDEETQTYSFSARARCDEFRQLNLGTLDFWCSARVSNGKIVSFGAYLTSESQSRFRKAQFAALSEKVFNGRNLDLMDRFISSNALDHDMPAGAPQGLAGVKEMMKQFFAAFPDARFTVEQMVSENNYVIARSIITATHKGEFAGLKATNRRITVECIDVVRYEGMLAVEHWSLTDMATLFAQLTAPNPPPQPAIKAPSFEKPTAKDTTARTHSVMAVVYRDVISGHNLRLAEHFISPYVVDHGMGGHNGFDGFCQTFEQFFAAFPDLKFEPQLLIAEDDMAAAIVTVSGTHKGDFMGLKPTGKTFSIKVFDIVRLSDGKVCERWGIVDSVGLQEQLSK